MQERGLINQCALNLFKSDISVYKDLAYNSYHEKWKRIFPRNKNIKTKLKYVKSLVFHIA